jgi:hypothetical protein
VVGRFCAETPFAVDDQRIAILDRCFVVCPCVRRSRLVDAGGFDETIPLGEDWECWIRLIRRGEQVGLVDAPLYRYRIRTSDADRVSSLRERVRVLEKVSVTAALTQEERDVLERSLARNRQRALLAEAESALRTRDSTARRRSLAVAVGPGFGLRTRLKALAAAVAPRAAGNHLAAREEETGWSRLQRGYPRG